MEKIELALAVLSLGVSIAFLGSVLFFEEFFKKYRSLTMFGMLFCFAIIALSFYDIGLVGGSGTPMGKLEAREDMHYTILKSWEDNYYLIRTIKLKGKLDFMNPQWTEEKVFHLNDPLPMEQFEDFFIAKDGKFHKVADYVKVIFKE